MKALLSTFFLVALLSCTDSTTSQRAEAIVETRELEPSIRDIVDSANVVGSVLIFNPNTNTYHSNDFDRALKTFLPASTFKIPNSIVALELGNAADENAILKWDGIVRNNKNWNRDLTLADAYKYSCVPCYQTLARKAGVANIKTQLNRLEYPGMVFDSSSVDLFWLQGESSISQMKQISFLQKLKTQQLPLKASTYAAMEKIMLYDKTEDCAIYGKTGMAIRDTVSYGWFIGYVGTKENTFYFATNIAPGEGMDLWGEFVPARIEVTLKALRSLDIIE
jgi:beta-lactamase class D